MSRRRVCYYYDAELGNYFYGTGHPMKPHRIRMGHNILLNSGMLKKMDIMRPHRATEVDMTRFHADDYIAFLKHISPDSVDQYMKQLLRFNVGEDSPVFDGIFDYCQLSAGGSLGAATRLNHGQYDIAINWAGGLHHAKKSEASGFCYVNDIVLGILELLKYHPRVLYIDIDIHHGDGVEEAFFTTNRVMTCSFHKFGDAFFPGTGNVRDIGAGPGRGYAMNFPLKDGMDDIAYRSIFRPVMQRIMEWYRPTAVVMQCGADSLYGDRLGCFNLTIQGHADCVEFIKSFNIPTMVLGGGGYTITNVSRCWAYETSVCIGQPLSDEMVMNDYYEYYAPEFRLFFPPSNMPNLNSPAYLSHILAQHFETMRETEAAPSVQMQDVPPDLLVDSEEEEDNIAAAYMGEKREKQRVSLAVEADANESDEEGDTRPMSHKTGRAANVVNMVEEEPKPSSRPHTPGVTVQPAAQEPAPAQPEEEEEEKHKMTVEGVVKEDEFVDIEDKTKPEM